MAPPLAVYLVILQDKKHINHDFSDCKGYFRKGKFAPVDL